MDKERRCDLVYAYWLLAELGLSDHTYTHLSARASGRDAFYMHPFGLRFEEVTLDNLITVDFQGHVLAGDERIPNPTGYQIHSAVYAKRADVQVIFHLHTPAMVAVSTMQSGLLPLTQWALHFYNKVAYHDYHSLALSSKEGQSMVDDLGECNIMLMRHHGALIAGRTAAEAMFYVHHLEHACKAQCLALQSGEPLRQIDPAICAQSVDDLLGFETHLGSRDWAAWLRWLARKGYPVHAQEPMLSHA